MDSNSTSGMSKIGAKRVQNALGIIKGQKLRRVSWKKLWSIVVVVNVIALALRHHTFVQSQSSQANSLHKFAASTGQFTSKNPPRLQGFPPGETSLTHVAQRRSYDDNDDKRPPVCLSVSPPVTLCNCIKRANNSTSYAVVCHAAVQWPWSSPFVRLSRCSHYYLTVDGAMKSRPCITVNYCRCFSLFVCPFFFVQTVWFLFYWECLSAWFYFFLLRSHVCFEYLTIQYYFVMCIVFICPIAIV